MPWRHISECLESGLIDGLLQDGNRSAATDPTVTEFEAEDRGGLDATPVTPPRKGTVPAHGNVNGKGRGKRNAPASGQGDIPLADIMDTSRWERRASKARQAPASALRCHLVVIKGGQQARGGDVPAGRTRSAGRERARELGWTVHSTASGW